MKIEKKKLIILTKKKNVLVFNSKLSKKIYLKPITFSINQKIKKQCESYSLISSRKKNLIFKYKNLVKFFELCPSSALNITQKIQGASWVNSPVNLVSFSWAPSCSDSPHGLQPEGKGIGRINDRKRDGPLDCFLTSRLKGLRRSSPLFSFRHLLVAPSALLGSRSLANRRLFTQSQRERTEGIDQRLGGQGHQGDYLTKVNKAKYLKKSDLVSRIINNKTNLKQTFLNFNFFITKKLYRQDFFSNKKIKKVFILFNFKCFLKNRFFKSALLSQGLGKPSLVTEQTQQLTGLRGHWAGYPKGLAVNVNESLNKKIKLKIFLNANSLIYLDLKILETWIVDNQPKFLYKKFFLTKKKKTVQNTQFFIL